MSKQIVLAVGPVVKRELMPAIKRASDLLVSLSPCLQISRSPCLPVSQSPSLPVSRSADHAARNVAGAAEMTFELVLRMQSLPTAVVARCLGTMVTAASLAQVLSDPDVWIGDQNIWFERSTAER